MPKLYDISEWSEQPWWNTGGTRNKKVYLNPEDDKLYYFKESYNEGKKNYEYEFWSEIVASEVGQLLGFDLLPYHIAIKGNVVGCLSESMIDPTSQELIEGGKYLQAFDNTFEPEDVKKRDRYDFQLIINSLFFFKMPEYVGNIIDLILFDAFIGNSDRHQENWALINKHSNISKTLSDVSTIIERDDSKLPNGFPGWLIKKLYTAKGKIRPEIKYAQILLPEAKLFAPIYDSGCSFGRELLNRKVRSMLSNPVELEKYVDRGKAEIHWETKKLNHFELLEKILNSKDYQTMLLESINRILRNYNENKIIEVIEKVDLPLIETKGVVGLPNERKTLMIKLLNSRYDRIEKLYQKHKP